jgi:hypothetical protein
MFVIIIISVYFVTGMLVPCIDLAAALKQLVLKCAWLPLLTTVL